MPSNNERREIVKKIMKVIKVNYDIKKSKI